MATWGQVGKLPPNFLLLKKDRTKAWRKRKYALGGCTNCGRPRSDSERKLCESCRAKNKLRGEQNRASLRKSVIDAYGGKCYCCGTDVTPFLSLDHINDDGYLEKYSGYHFYRKVIKEGFPDKYRLACHNCNLGRRMNGGICPHVAR